MSRESLVWPTFYIAGGVKCGTTSLYAYLKRHPQVFLPEMKEPHYFATIFGAVPTARASMHCPGDLDTYQRIYRPGRDFPAIGDASPSYLWDEGSPRAIHKVCPQARIVILLRDPIERAYSHFLMQVTQAEELLPFLEALQRDQSAEKKGLWISNLYVESGLYYSQVRRFLETFGREQVAICFFEDLRKAPFALLAQVTAHIGVAPAAFGGKEISEAHNRYRQPRFPGAIRLANTMLSPEVRRRLIPEPVRRRLRNSSLLYDMKKPPLDDKSRRYLKEIFEPDVSLLEELLGQELPQLRRSWNPLG